MQRLNLPCDALQGVLHTLVTHKLMKPVRFLLLLLLGQNTGIFPLFRLVCKVKQTKTVVIGGKKNEEERMNGSKMTKVWDGFP